MKLCCWVASHCEGEAKEIKRDWNRAHLSGSAPRIQVGSLQMVLSTTSYYMYRLTEKRGVTASRCTSLDATLAPRHRPALQAAATPLQCWLTPTCLVTCLLPPGRTRPARSLAEEAEAAAEAEADPEEGLAEQCTLPQTIPPAPPILPPSGQAGSVQSLFAPRASFLSRGPTAQYTQQNGGRMAAGIGDRLTTASNYPDLPSTPVSRECIERSHCSASYLS